MPSKGKIKAVKSLVGKLKLSKDEEISLYSAYGFEHCSDLNDEQAKEIISSLSEMAKAKGIPKPEKKYYGKGERGRQRHLTPAQAERIGLLKELLQWSDEGLTNFIKQQTKKLTGVQMLMNYEAVKVIVGLQRVAKGYLSLPYEYLNEMNNKELKNLVQTYKNKLPECSSN